MRALGQILIVDDDAVMRRLISSALEEQGCSVVAVASGVAALQEALDRLPDLILLDVLLPDIDGIAICRRVRAAPRLAEVPVIVITALNDPEARRASIEAGADDFITKPVDFLELKVRVASILRLNRYRLLLEERTQRQRAEEETLRRNQQLSLLNSFIVSMTAKLGTVGQIEAALYDACRVLIQTLNLAEAYAWLHIEGQIGPLAASEAAFGPVSAAMLAPHRFVGGIDQRPDQSPEEVDSHLPLALPLRINGKIGGTLTLIGAPGRYFDSNERAFVQSLVAALGQAIESALLHRQLQTHVDNLAGVVTTRTDELQAERDRTQAILDALGEAVIVTNSDWVINYANPATTALTGYPVAELIGRAWSEIQGEVSAAALGGMIRDHARSGQTWSGEVSGFRRDGRAYDAAMTVAPLFDPRSAGWPTGLVSILRDITPLKAAERMKDHFISNVSHELRTPLAVIALHSGNLDTLYERLGDEQRRQLIREVRAQAGLLDELIGDVLELSRIDSGRMLAKHHLLDLAELLCREADLLRPLAERKGLRLVVEAVMALPVLGDQAQLGLCIRNLVSNAIKYTPPGGTLHCECWRMETGPVEQGAWPAFFEIDTGSWAGLRVVDSGIGISAEHLPHIFERFYRVQGQSRVPGSGLGLAITRELITRHGGWTGVSSTPGAGSTFAFYLPLAGEGTKVLLAGS